MNAIAMMTPSKDNMYLFMVFRFQVAVAGVLQKSHLLVKPIRRKLGEVHRHNGVVPMQSISFDVAVTAAKGTKTQGGIAVFTGIIGLGSKGQSEKSNEIVNRIQFSVPMAELEMWQDAIADERPECSDRHACRAAEFLIAE